MTDLTPPPIPDGFLNRWCTTLSRGSESPPGAFLPSGLAALSATVGPRLVMEWGIAHEERMNLWVLNVGLSALGRKTSGLAGLRRAVGWIKDGDDDLVRMHTFSRISDAGLVAALDIVTEDTAKAKPEDLDGGRPHVIRDVPMSWVTVFNEVAPIWQNDQQSWALAAQQVMLSIYDGQLSSTTKATKVPSQECFVTAIGNIPPGVLRNQTTLPMLSSGFVGRWLVIPTPPPENLVSFPARQRNGADPLDYLRNDIEKLMRLARRTTKTVVNDLWSGEALAARLTWYERHHETIRRADPDDAIGSARSELFGRLQATAVKVATLLAVGRGLATLNRLDEVTVEAVDVQWAAQVIDQSMDYVTSTLVDSGADSFTHTGRVEGRVLRILEKAEAYDEANSLTATTIAQRAKGGDVSHEDVRKAVTALIELGVVECGADGRARRVWIAANQSVRVAA